jgi:hypothetical protein
VLPLHVGYLFETGYYKEPEASLTRDFPFEYMKQGKNISGDERRGFKVAKVNLALSDRRLRLFLEGKEDWLEEGLLVPAKKNKRGRIIGEGSSTTQEGGAQQNYVPPLEEFRHRRVTMVVYQCKHGGVVQP